MQLLCRYLKNDLREFSNQFITKSVYSSNTLLISTKETLSKMPKEMGTEQCSEKWRRGTITPINIDKVVSIPGRIQLSFFMSIVIFYL